ncbi:anti-sigma factor [Aurantivibrio infirmus]
MNYNNDELIERLSAEYVLGTLQGKARNRFERLIYESYRTRLAVWSWECQLNPLGKFAPQKKPPKHVWQSIRTRLNFSGKNDSAELAARQNLKKLLGFWRGWGLAASFACAIFAVLFTTGIPTTNPGTNADHVAVFSSEQAEPQWLVSFDLNTGSLKAKALNVTAIEASQAFELWILPGADAAPRSLGLLPVAAQGETNNQIPQALVELLRSASGLAVSLEPAGGSPTGAPTGPVLFQSQLLEL